MTRRRWWLAGLVVAVLVVVAAAALASPAPDGLERVATEIGFADQATDSPSGLLDGYVLPGVGDDGISTILAGVAGVAVLFVSMVLLGRALSRRDRSAG